MNSLTDIVSQATTAAKEVQHLCTDSQNAISDALAIATKFDEENATSTAFHEASKAVVRVMDEILLVRESDNRISLHAVFAAYYAALANKNAIEAKWIEKATGESSRHGVVSGLKANAKACKDSAEEEARNALELTQVTNDCP